MVVNIDHFQVTRFSAIDITCCWSQCHSQIFIVHDGELLARRKSLVGERCDDSFARDSLLTRWCPASASRVWCWPSAEWCQAGVSGWNASVQQLMPTPAPCAPGHPALLQLTWKSTFQNTNSSPVSAHPPDGDPPLPWERANDICTLVQAARGCLCGDTLLPQGCLGHKSLFQAGLRSCEHRHPPALLRLGLS